LVGNSPPEMPLIGVLTGYNGAVMKKTP